MSDQRDQRDHTTPTRHTIYRVVDYDTGEALPGVASPGLIEASEAVSDGAVLARLDADLQMWDHVEASDADRMRVYEGVDVRTVYVEDVRGADEAEGAGAEGDA